ncbi:MAG TPA: hypothetical protein VGI75_00485, partial [Pirellulales bacterium]
MKKRIVAVIGAAFLIGSAWMAARAIAAISNLPKPLTGSTAGDAASGSGRQTAGAAGSALTRTRYEFSRVQSFTEWWQMPLLMAVCALVLVFVAYMYRRDSVELKPGFGVLLALLRLAAFAGVLLMFLDVQRHTETKVVRNSRVVLLADTSLSMSRADAQQALPGSSNSAENASGSGGSLRRIDQVAGALGDEKFINAL